MTEEHSSENSDAKREYEKRLLRKRQSDGFSGFVFETVFDGCMFTIPRLFIRVIGAIVKSVFDD